MVESSGCWWRCLPWHCLIRWWNSGPRLRQLWPESMRTPAKTVTSGKAGGKRNSGWSEDPLAHISKPFGIDVIFIIRKLCNYKSVQSNISKLKFKYHHLITNSQGERERANTIHVDVHPQVQRSSADVSSGFFHISCMYWLIQQPEPTRSIFIKCTTFKYILCEYKGKVYCLLKHVFALMCEQYPPVQVFRY